ncbi:MAG: hypothetical protein ACD_47C00413G0003 [uncultured bacterium]|nr:MAG: hypothetical protein ACD_47C00413G0003 [uncultured bacterium]
MHNSEYSSNANGGGNVNGGGIRSIPLEWTPSQLLVISFLTVILIGTFLLTCGFSAQPGVKIGYIDALFTATSAVCVTGLTSVDTPMSYSFIGQIIILLLVQFGGLGIMTIVTFGMSAVSGRVSLRFRLFAREDRPSNTSIDLVELIKYVFIITITIEAIGALILFTVFKYQKGYAAVKALYFAVFHSVSAFCNAGFALFSDSLMSFDGNLAVHLVIGSLIIIGGIGFNTIVDIIYFFRTRSRYQLSLNTKITLFTSLILIVSGFLIILLLEYNNPTTIGTFPLHKKIYASLFQSITLRTAGFNTIDNGLLLPPTLLLCMIFMFIGASPGGTGGGIKTTTTAILFKSIMRSIHDDTQIVIFKKAVPKESISKSVAVFTISMILILFGAFALLFCEKFGFVEILFETVSAFGTVGLSMGITAKLSAFGKLVITAIMFLGRVGSLTVVFALAKARPKLDVRYPEETVLIG